MEAVTTQNRRKIKAVPSRVLPGEATGDRPLRWALSHDNSGPFPEFDGDTVRRLQELVSTRVRLHRGATLYRPGAPFAALYAIHSGSLKTVILTKDGHDQVAGYHMQGELIGLDGIGNDVHECQAIALEDSEVCVMLFARIEEAARDFPAFQRKVHRYLSHEIAQQHSLMLLLGTMRAEQRVATFLLELSQRYKARGYSPSEFVLRMTREEIGSYLGIKLETVSRLLTRFQKQDLIHVQGRVVKLLDRAALENLVHAD